MNAKEARDIIQDGDGGEYMFFKAKGYLEAHENVKGLVEKHFDNIEELCMDENILNQGPGDLREKIITYMNKALAKWEEQT